MRFDKLTIKSQELIQNAQSLASSYNHQQIEPEHILSAMLNEPDGIARSMLNKLGVSGDDIFRELAAAIDRVVQHSIIIEFGKEIPSLRAEEAARRNQIPFSDSLERQSDEGKSRRS